MRSLRFYLLISGAVLIMLYGIVEAAFVIHTFGFGILEAVNLPGALKNDLSLLLTLSFLSLIFSLASAVSSGFWASSLSVLAVVFGIASIASVKLMNFQTLVFLETMGLISIGVLAYGSGSTYETGAAPPTLKFSTVETASIAIFSALTASATAFTGQFFPSPTGGYTHIGDSVIFIASLIYGSKVGALVGAIGAVAADLYVGYPRWFISIPAHGLEGFIAGLGKSRKMYVQVALCLLGGMVMALTYFYVNVFIKGFGPALISLFRDVFGQVTVSLIITVIVKPVLSKISSKKI
ncbi:ECF transporter S component [Candidatus Bathyarchaeota archaeon]|nr:ECF transporter S component [Candidatus Bathyarchaeota archaeon]MBS7613321.1 ECF transporter S component [Candidatus Bathyarchaeota archaeon]MBS7617026.1 ECF transporter S component [Candidatus Bathyarchaeota archaeon]